MNQASPASLLIVGQAGRLEFEAIIFLASLRRASPDWQGKVIVAEPRPEGGWSGYDTLLSDAARGILTDLGAQIVPFTSQVFGSAYPQGNKIEALSLLPANEPFVFFDTDTLITGPIDAISTDFSRPSASMRREGTWPLPPLYGPGYAGIWKSLYDRFGLNFDSSLDPDQPDEHWERYLYFNAGWFLGNDPVEFGRRYLSWAKEVRDDPNDELACQVLDPWLDQIVLPLVINSFGGGRPGPELNGLDGNISFHYRKLPLLYALGSEEQIAHIEASVADKAIKQHLKTWEPARKLIYQEKGRDKVRSLFAGRPLPRQERAIRNQIKSKGWWLV
jgi:hypothetical protein